MDRIEDYQAFVATVEKGSLTAAANQLGRSLQSVSRSLAALEREVGVELIRRTTRRSNPTDAGCGAVPAAERRARRYRGRQA